MRRRNASAAFQSLDESSRLELAALRHRIGGPTEPVFTTALNPLQVVGNAGDRVFALLLLLLGTFHLFVIRVVARLARHRNDR